MEKLYRGQQVRGWDDLKRYTGLDACDVIIGRDRREAYRVNYEQLRANYTEGVEFQLRRQLAILCPQTADFLYGPFTPRRSRYVRGTRPVLEQLVAEETVGATLAREKALALMRFCRDLYKKDGRRDFHGEDYIFGGTEEELVAKGEELCECLGRLFVALCEIAGIPGRIVMHVIGGHIVAEVLVEEGWAYIDPHAGMYFLKPDGGMASTWELWHNPVLLCSQPETVRAEVSDRWTWEERAWKCRAAFFHSFEINGFMNYSPAEAEKYDYHQTTGREAAEAGLWKQNRIYCRLTNKIFGLTENGKAISWRARTLRRLPLIYRNDGFTPFFYEKPPMTRSLLEQKLIDPLADSNVTVLEWGLGPGSVFCFDTRAGQVFGEGLSDRQLGMLRQGDRWVRENVTGLIREGHDPLRTAVERGHELGMKVSARLEMNHEYGPASEENWMWVGLVGDLNKQNPQFRIPGCVNLDFRHAEVREFKKTILREAAEAGCDGVSMDFSVYLPHFKTPDPVVMTGFVRDVRAMLDEVGRMQGRRIGLMVRVPCRMGCDFGLDWRRWMAEKLIDAIVPWFAGGDRPFDVDIDEVVSLGNRTGVKVYGSIFHSLAFVTTDATPEDEGRQRYDKPKTREIDYAQALLLHRAGADGIQLAMAGDEWNRKPWYNDLADPGMIEFADKRYMANVGPRQLVTLTPGRSGSVRTTVSLRIADDLSAAVKAGYRPEAEILFYCRPLQPGETIEVAVNGKPGTMVENAPYDRQTPVNPDQPEDPSFIYDSEWWRRGEHRVKIDAARLKLGKNSIRFQYSALAGAKAAEVRISWVDVTIRYSR